MSEPAVAQAKKQVEHASIATKEGQFRRMKEEGVTGALATGFVLLVWMAKMAKLVAIMMEPMIVSVEAKVRIEEETFRVGLMKLRAIARPEAPMQEVVTKLEVVLKLAAAKKVTEAELPGVAIKSAAAPTEVA